MVVLPVLAMVMTVIMVVTVAMVVTVIMARIGACGTVVVRVRGRLEPSDAPRDAESSHKRRCEAKPVMGVELQLRQQVRCRDAQERARTERERKPEDPSAIATHAKGKRNRAQRHNGREDRVHRVASRRARTRRSKHGRQRHRIEWLVQQHDEHRRETGKRPVALSRTEFDRRGNRDALERTVQA